MFLLFHSQLRQSVFESPGKMLALVTILSLIQASLGRGVPSLSNSPGKWRYIWEMMCWLLRLLFKIIFFYLILSNSDALISRIGSMI